MIKRVISSCTFLILNAIGLYFVILGVQAWLTYGVATLCYVGLAVLLLCTIALLWKNTIIHRISLALLFLIIFYCLTVLILLIQTSRPLWLGILFSILFLLSLVGLGFLLLKTNAHRQDEKQRVVSGVLQSIILLSAILYSCIRII